MLGQVPHNTWKAMIRYDFDLCRNEQCTKKLSCEHYLIYAREEWEHCYVMRGCIDYQLLKQVIK